MSDLAPWFLGLFWITKTHVWNCSSSGNLIPIRDLEIPEQ